MELKKRIVIDCQYQVYDKEWEDLRKLIKGLLSGSNIYSNMDCVIDNYYPEEE
jgi:hypothetical protein